jgi:hypothetical protein
MLISINSDRTNNEFVFLLHQTLDSLATEANQNEKSYLNLHGRKLENKVYDIMNINAKGTPFENSIELISGQKFPDIIAKRYFGVEVKTTKQNHWKTTGNSVLESTRVDGIERIYMLFGKLFSPIEFKCRPYEECLSEVVVTHSPRYLINMEIEKNETIFEKLKIPYNKLRKQENPIKPILKYYRSLLKEGEDIWWLESDEEKSKSLVIKFWNSLSIPMKEIYISKGMLFFPEIFNSNFNRFSLWLYENESVICPNVRDLFTAKGKGSILHNNIEIKQIPRIIVNLDKYIKTIKSLIEETPNSQLKKYWQINSIDNKTSVWIDLVISFSKKMKLNFNLYDYLLQKMNE